MSSPTFFIVGAPKCGTTALSSYLSKHPDIFIPDVKELHFFGTDLEFLPPGRNFKSVPRDKNELTQYLSFFDGVNGEAVVGEASVWYLYSQKAAEEIKKFAPNAKIIIMLRNPAELIYSMHSQALWEGNENIEEFSSALAAEQYRKEGKQLPSTMQFREGLYYRETVKFYAQIERFIESFSSDQLLILIYEEFFERPEISYREVLAFLGVDPSYKPTFGRVNANKIVRNRLLLEILTNPSNLTRLSGKLIPQAIRSRLIHQLRKVNTKYTTRAPLEPRLRASLLQEFRSDIEDLQDLLGRDLSLWFE